MNDRYLIASANGYLSDLGFIPYAANASRFTLTDAKNIERALPGTWRLLDESFYVTEDMRQLPEFHLLCEASA